MIIKNGNEVVQFESLETGDCFELADAYYMLINPNMMVNGNCVNLSTGRVCELQLETFVKPLPNAFLTV